MAYDFTPLGSGSKSPLSPNNAVSTELKSDPSKTRSGDCGGCRVESTALAMSTKMPASCLQLPG